MSEKHKTKTEELENIHYEQHRAINKLKKVTKEKDALIDGYKLDVIALKTRLNSAYKYNKNFNIHKI